MLTAEDKRMLWLKGFEENRDAVRARVRDGIERYRKGPCRIRLSDTDGAPLAHRRVTVRQTTHDFKFGANLFMLDGFEREEDDRAYRALFKEYFNLATVPFYWDTLEPERGKPRFDKDSPRIYRRPAPDLCLEYCEQNGIEAKLHCLVYDKCIPDWLPKDDRGAMEEAYEKRIREIAARCAGRLREFEVINETLCEFGWKTDSVIMDKRDVVEWAFALARRYLPRETLVINEYDPLPSLVRQDYRAAYFMQIEKCLLNGASIDRIGLQHHILTGVKARTAEQYEEELSRPKLVDPLDHYKMLDLMAEFGLPLELTEVTVPTFGETEEDEQLQAELLEGLYSVWFSHPAVDSVVYWNQIDGYAYVSEDPTEYWNENNCRGGLFRHDLTPKRSALALRRLIREVWHTKETAETDGDGQLTFSGFFGEYRLECAGRTTDFGLHKGGENEYRITL